MNRRDYDIAVIGGGASGLMASITAGICDPEKSIAVFERLEKVGKKLLATGNGCCNLTNASVSPENFHSQTEHFFEGIYNQFNHIKTLEFFKSIGVVTAADESGKIYPRSRQASALLDALRFKAESLRVEFFCGFEAVSIRKENEIFKIGFLNGREITAKKLIMAAGGKASPHLGSNGSGYELLKKLGHTITPLFTGIVQVKTETETVRPLKGIKIFGTAKITHNQTVLKEETGEILFTEYGLSGPPVLALSRTVSEFKGNRLTIGIDVLPAYSGGELFAELKELRKNLSHLTLENFLTGLVNKRLGQTLVKRLGLPLSKGVSALTDGDLMDLSRLLKGFNIEVVEPMPFKNAQVTCGGANLREFSGLTLESKLIKNLYACGEVLDMDGDCGGYNLQWAWSSGYTAGFHAAQNTGTES